ncbi:hypothetical protein [Hyalangium rubrum]|uniref:Uncharacterized protein n=1 Tax=Hyalangium rubrum TaxID=3103134 RepID=A0ABU5H5E1_9BACT|nr:hypothetical protein [Hyalangium sp. s54d21]MDY7227305.1 hypothetical protein [Hyalangium sp. s54d21]
MARRKQPDETPARVRNLIALDAALIMRRLAARRDEMFTLFSRLRSREPMLSTITTRFNSATFHDLVHLPEREQAVVHAFHERLDEMRWYFTYTEDMPSTVQQTFTALYRRLEEAYRLLVVTLGPPVTPDGAVVVEAQPVRTEEAPSAEVTLARARPARKRASSSA